LTQRDDADMRGADLSIKRQRPTHLAAGAQPVLTILRAGRIASFFSMTMFHPLSLIRVIS
jgi:hypothetical protein